LMLLIPAIADAGSYYFVTVRGGLEQPEESHKVLREMVKLADAQHIRLTLLFGAKYALYISSSPTRTIELENWKATGHEIGAYHQGPDMKDWDGYSDLPEKDLSRVRKDRDASPGARSGSLDYFAAIGRLASEIKTGCMMDRVDKKFLAAAPKYETCFAPDNGLEYPAGHSDSGSGGINYSLISDKSRGEGKKRLSCSHPSDRGGVEAAKKAFSGMETGGYGASFDSSPSEFGAFFAWLKFLKRRDPQGLRSRTVSEIVGNKLLPEKKIQADPPSDGEAEQRNISARPAVPKKDPPRLKRIHNPYTQVERMHFGPDVPGKQHQKRGFCGDGVCAVREKTGQGRCPRDCDR